MINRMENDRHANANSGKLISVLRNERLTATAGAILLVLIIAELIITANLHALITVHIFVGVLLCGPLVVKMGSTGYRFLRYYSKNPAFVKNGPPNPLLRLLAPFLVLMTLLVFISGIGLAIVGPHHMGLLFDIHAASVAMWLPLLAVHVYAYLRKVSRLIGGDWGRQAAQRVRGRGGRLGLNLAALVVGLIAAIVMMPVSNQWSHWRIGQGLPSPLVAGLFAAVVAVWIGIPLLRRFNHRR